MDSLQTTLDASQSSSSELSASAPSSLENSFSSKSEHPPEHSFLSAASKSEHPLAQLAKEVKQQPFTTNKSVQELLEHRRQELQEDHTRDQFLVFTSVPPAQASELSDERSRTSKYCRFTFNTETEILIAKVIPLTAHETAARHFERIITCELFAMNLDRELASTGSTTVRIINWTKEADCCWAPGPRSKNPKISFVVEVGLSESTPHLALDAHGWLETPSSSVNLVVTIAIRREHPEIILQQWELPTRRSNVVTRSSPILAHRTAVIKLSRINNTTSVTGESYMNGTTTNITQMDLPFNKILNRPPNPPLERDFVISAQHLRDFAEDVWGMQELL
ncbi:hypothetical protein BJX63DRAFT_434993 [Aspergillus granulosus]|uniref:Uncharacterized protein n=1 Tax=Aspergillus granulosus TaxID=176169 RepID=A0ABR4H2F3_9EURO